MTALEVGLGDSWRSESKRPGKWCTEWEEEEGSDWHQWVFMRACVPSRDQLWDPMTVALQTPLSTGFSRWEYWSGLPFLPPGDLPDPGIKPRSLAGGQTQVTSATSEVFKRWLKDAVLLQNDTPCSGLLGGWPQSPREGFLFDWPWLNLSASRWLSLPCDAHSRCPFTLLAHSTRQHSRKVRRSMWWWWWFRCWASENHKQ